MSDSEEWRDIPGFSRYQVSSLGRLRLLLKFRYGRDEWYRILNGHEGIYGYMKSGLTSDEGVVVQKTVHQWVALAFYGPPPTGMEVRHLDGNRKNNHVANLKYGTRTENARDKIAHGTLMFGETHPSAKLQDRDLPIIRSAIEAGVVQRDVARAFGVSPALITLIKQGKARRRSVAQTAGAA